MVLRGDVDDLLFEIFDWLIASMVAELELEGLSSQRQGNDLVPQAYSEDGDNAREVLDSTYGLLCSLWIARTIGEE